MAGAADIAGAAGFERLIGAHLVADVMARAAARIHGLAEFVIEPLGGEIALLLRDPFVQPEMRRDDEFGMGGVFHGDPPSANCGKASRADGFDNPGVRK